MSKQKHLSTPSYCLHKATGQGYVKLNGKCHYLGDYHHPETRQNYHQLVAQWELNGRVLITPPEDVRIIHLIDRYYAWAKKYYRKPDGNLTSSILRIKASMRPLKEMYGLTPVTEFGPIQLKTVRYYFVKKGLARKTVNDYTKTVKQCFKWGGEEGMVPASIYGSLQLVAGLQEGRSDAKETAPVMPIDMASVHAVMGHVSLQVQALIQLQLLTGARPGELVALRPIDFDTSEDIWTYTPKIHKTSHRGKERVIYFGPKAKIILKEFFDNRQINMPLFSPKDAEQERYENAYTHQRQNQEPIDRKTNRTLGNSYTVDSYRRAIYRACRNAGIPSWSPNQLRHNTATTIRADYGLEAAQVILGHSRADVTQVYAERDLNLAKRVISIYG